MVQVRGTWCVGLKKTEPDLHGSVQWKDKRQQAQIMIQKILFKHKNTFLWVWSAMKQLV